MLQTTILGFLLFSGMPTGIPSAAGDLADSPVKVVRVETPPKIDGSLTDAAWKDATVISEFLQIYPQEGGQPTVETRVLFLHTATALYVGIRAQEPAGSVVATTLRRDNIDQLTQDDQFAIAIDSYNDGRNGYWFSTNALGVRVDGQFFDEGSRWEMNWDGIWQSAAQTTTDGWSAEIEIPFSTMRFTVGERNVMGINMYRRVIGTNEHLFSPLIPLRYSTGSATVSIARKFLFEGITGGRNLQVKPYGLAGLRKDDYSDSGETDGQLDAGLDLRYGLTDNLTATLSFNTDFAQVEVDERQINLTRFSLFFPEKRDFFLENSGSFTFGFSEEAEVFFSRRIGLATDTSGSPTSVPILAGGKLTGKLGRADVGLLNVQTRSSGSSPAENFGVARVKLGVLPRSYVGAVFTNKWSEDDPANRVFGADMKVYFVGDVGMTGFAAAVSGPDHEFSKSSALHLGVFKGGERASFNLGVTDIGSTFDPVIGFVLRPGTRKWQAQSTLPWYATSSSLRQIAPGLEMVYYDGHDGRLQSAFHRAQVKAEWQSEDQMTGFVSRTFEYLARGFEIFPNVVVPMGRYTDYTAGIEASSKPGRRISARTSLAAGQLFDGDILQLQTDVLWKVNRNFSLATFFETTHVDLDDRSFRAYVTRTRIDCSLNTSFSVIGLLQYDNASEQLGLNLRLNYIVREGTELFLVYNGFSEQPRIGDSLRLGTPLRRSVLLKATYLL